ncbi:Cysteine protease atg4 [Entomortierella chlamydospora]|nr:Cysteine protease atg4 [Entomortierella chlamydospora]
MHPPMLSEPTTPATHGNRPSGNAQVPVPPARDDSPSLTCSAVATEQVHDHIAAAGLNLSTPAATLDKSLASQETLILTENKDLAPKDTVEAVKQNSPEKVIELAKQTDVQSAEATQEQLRISSSEQDPSQTLQTENQDAALPSRLGSRFSVNLSGVGIPSMASNLGLTQANGERAADMAQDLKKNVVNMWNAWFPTPPTPSSTSSTAATRAPSGTQSLSHHPNQGQRPSVVQRTNSYSMKSSAGSGQENSLSSSELVQSVNELGDTLEQSSTVSNLPEPSERHIDPTTRIVHEANDPIANRSSTCAPPPSNTNNGPIYLMGKLYPPSPTQWADFQRDFTLGLIWCTYRHGYQPIRPSNFTSDVGWGCMLRSGQGLLSNALAIQFMGRGWNRPAPGDPEWSHYVRILSWFLDDMNAKSPFSVHRIALLGKQLGKNIGEWFGPSTTSQVIKALVHNFPESGLSVYVTTDGVIYKDQVEEVMKKPGGFGQLLILVTIRLGIDKLNPIYNEAIKSTFEFPQSLGIAGGRPSSSYYFVGYQGDDLFYLDPHHSRFVVETKELSTYTVEDLASYHCEVIRKIDINAIDPSMLLAFYCRDRSEYDAFCERVREMNARPGMGSSIFTIGEKAPDYDDSDTRLLSVADDDDDDLELIL